MLLNDFFKIVSEIFSEKNSFRYVISIDKNHFIFTGHFPEIPVVPGVCMMQIVKELLEKKYNKKLQLAGAGNIKFLSVINPCENPQAEVEIGFSENCSKIIADAEISLNGKMFFKIQNAEYECK